MVAVDYSQVALSTIFAHTRSPGQINEGLIRHTILDCLRSYNMKYGEKYGRLVICADSKRSWRKEVFSYYKANRKKNRDNSEYDWGMILDTLQTIKDEIRENFPYQVIEVFGAEADDVIATLATVEPGPFLILSGDHDFGQLQKFPNVSQFAPIQKKWIKVNDPLTFKHIHIMSGDIGDGIPNFLSADDCLVRDGARQKPLRKSNLEEWSKMPPERFCTTQMLRGYRRNETLIDFDFIPDKVKNGIMDEFGLPWNEKRNKIFNYMVKYRLTHLLESINEF